MVVSIPTTLALGFLYGLWFPTAFLPRWVLPFTFLMVYPAMVGLAFKKVFSGGDGRLQVATQAMNFIAIPALAFGLGAWLLPDEPVLRLGLFLTGLLPTSGMTLSWTKLAGGNLPSAVKMTVIGLVAGALLAPIYMQGAFHQVISIPIQKTFSQIALVVFLPMVLAFATQSLLRKKFGPKRFDEEIRPQFGPWGVLGVLGVQFIAMATNAHTLYDHPGRLLLILLPIAAFYLVNFTLSTLLASLFAARADGIAFIYGTALRNLAIALAIAMTTFGSAGADAALLVSLGFVLQAQLAAWHVRFIDKLLPVRQ
jgi:ACR3 family arsenite efflux pump ArsB